tara:strand:- start:149 stop:427 length:279 start_codon:yes stop_codon:yes gene_type:complete
MKKLIMTSYVLFASAGILFAESHCQKKDFAYIKESKLEIVLTSNNLQLLKYSDKNGNHRFTIKNLDGTIVAENMSRLELRIDFPEIEKKFKS